METGNLRNTALNMLLATVEEGKLGSQVLRELRTESRFSSRDRAFLQRLYTGTLKKLVYLDFILDAYSRIPVRKMKPVIRGILRISLYQMLFMDSVPCHACINEAVGLTKKRGFAGLSGFVNGLLRTVSREGVPGNLPDYVNACTPEWIFRLVREQYGAEAAKCFFEAAQEETAEITIRLNPVQSEEEQILDSLKEEGCVAEKLAFSRGGYRVAGFESLTSLTAYRNGWIVMQDTSSMAAVELMAQKLSETRGFSGPAVEPLILDVCSAPGGKSLYLSRLFPQARILARDLTEQKVHLIRENLARLHISNVTPQVHDALVPDSTLTGACSLVVCDLPCSGLGVLKRKPDLMHRLKPEDLTQLKALQQNILAVAQDYVKPGGVLAYSTCTINRGENQENSRWFLQSYGFERLAEQQFLPGRDPCDGFYIACYRRKMME